MNTAKISFGTVLLAISALAVLVIPQNLFASVTVYDTPSRREFLTKVYADQRANGGVNEETAAHGSPQYQSNQVSPTGQRICQLYDPTAWPSNWSLGGFDSPGNNRMAAWDPVTNRWFVRSAREFNNSRYNYITCKTNEKADASLTGNGVSEVTINPGESVNLSWYSQYGAIRKATCTATNFTTVVTVPASTATVPTTTCGGGPWGFDNFLSFVDSSDYGNRDCSTSFDQVTVGGSSGNQPFSGSKTVSPTQTTTYTYSCANGNGTNTASVTVNVIQPEVEPVAVSCTPSPSSGVTNEPITWTAQVFNHDGPFTYEWQGSDGLTGTAASVVKSYANTGTKTARVKVTFTPDAAEEPTTPTTVTSTCLPGGSEVPAGYLCSAGGLQTVEWGQCCTGYARVQCPAPNEPAEAYCTGINNGSTPDTGGSIATGSGVWEYVSTDISDLACVIGGIRVAPNNARPRINMQVCPNADPSGQACSQINQRCKSSAWQGNYSCVLDTVIYRCVSAAPQPDAPLPPTEEGFSITTDCDGTVCTNRTCTVDPGGSGTTSQPNNPNSTADPLAPTWGVTINLPGQCSVGPVCIGTEVHNQSLDCSREFVRTCPFGCMSGQCVAPRPEIDLSVSPAAVRRGESCSIQVAARHVSGCTVRGQGISEDLAPNAGGVVESQTFTTPGVNNTSTYTVSCDSPRGSVSESVQCVLLPVFRET